LQEPTWPGNLFLTGNATMAVDMTVNGNLTVSGTMDVNGKSVTITGNFTSNGLLKMQNATGVLTVNGTMSINGASESGLLTAGLLNVKGNFTEGSSCCSSNFDTTGTFRVLLSGSGAQTVSFIYPGTGSGTSHFRDLEITNTAGSVTMSSDVVVDGSLIVQGSGTRFLIGGGKTLTVAGLDVNGLSLNNVLLVVQPGTLTRFDNVTFSGYSSSATQMKISHPGAASPFTFNNLTFNSSPTTGFYIDATDTVVNDGNIFTINLVNPSPAAQTRFQTHGGAVIAWP
jgi:hypothetical protein